MSEDVCPNCFGTGTVTTPQGARACDCRRVSDRERLARLLAAVPERYQGVTLASLQARPDLHPDQQKVIDFMRERPDVNYCFCGNNDVGKTHFFYALRAHAVTAGRHVVAMTLKQLVQKYQDAINRKEGYSPGDFGQSRTRYSLFLDDIDKARPTEYVMELLFDLLDQVYVNKHQLVVTTQLHPTQEIAGRASLVDHFTAQHPRFAGGIVRRIVNDETALWRLF